MTVLVAGWGNGLFDPATSRDEGRIYQRLLQGFLVEGDETRSAFLPGIATEWEMSPDGKTWTFTIADNIVAHNGEPVTADDVVGTWDILYGDTGKQRVAAGEQFWGGIISQQDLVEKVEKVGPNQVALTFKEPDIFGAFRSSANTPTLTGIILPMDYWNEVGSDGYEAKPVGIGPFRVASFKPQQEIVFERFDDYYYQPKNGYPEDRRAKIDELILRVVPDPATRLAALEAGQADVIAADVGMISQIDAMGKKVVWSEEGGYVLYKMNQCWLPELWCYKTEVRQALDYALDKEAIVNELYGGTGASATGLAYVTPSAYGYSPAIDPRPFDLAKAKMLLAEAGFPDGSGIPPVTLYTWSDSPIPFFPEVAQIMADSWGRLGIDVKVQVRDVVSIKDLIGSWEVEPGVRKPGGGDPGSIYLKPGKTRWLGLVPTIEDFGIPPVTRGRLCGEEHPRCVEIDRMLDALPFAEGLEAIEEPYTEALEVIFDNATMVQIATTNTPWGIGENVQFEPWRLTTNELSPIWTLDKP